MKKVLGAGPQFIKASVVSHAISSYGRLNEVGIRTGQRFEANMSAVLFSELDMLPLAYNLEIHGGGHGDMTGRMLIEIERVLQAEKLDAVLIYGDTNATLASALAAVKLRQPVTHVEAGLRLFNMTMSEEINRILTDRISRWLFTPTDAAKAHLERDSAPPDRIAAVGDVMYDVALHHGALVHAEGRMLGQLDLQPHSFVLATGHRPHNADAIQRLAAMVAALEIVTAQWPGVRRLHPRTRAILSHSQQREKLSRSVHPGRSYGVSGHGATQKVRCSDCHRLRRHAKESLLPPRALHDAARRNRTGGTCGYGLEPPALPLSPQAVSSAVLQAIGTQGSNIRPYGERDAARRIVEHLSADLGA